MGAEFFSLSKSFNLTGARLSFFVGNRELVSALSLLRSQLDFGIFLPLQLAAVEALRVPRQYVLDQCQEYRKRRDALCNGLREAGWPVEDSQGTMFAWARIPELFLLPAVRHGADGQNRRDLYARRRFGAWARGMCASPWFCRRKRFGK